MTQIAEPIWNTEIVDDQVYFVSDITMERRKLLKPLKCEVASGEDSVCGNCMNPMGEAYFMTFGKMYCAPCKNKYEQPN